MCGCYGRCWGPGTALGLLIDLTGEDGDLVELVTSRPGQSHRLNQRTSVVVFKACGLPHALVWLVRGGAIVALRMLPLGKSLLLAVIAALAWSLAIVPIAGAGDRLQFARTTPSGAPFDGASLWGRPVVMFFWASWC